MVCCSCFCRAVSGLPLRGMTMAIRFQIQVNQHNEVRRKEPSYERRQNASKPFPWVVQALPTYLSMYSIAH